MARTQWGMSGVLIAGVCGCLQASYIHESPFSTGYAMMIIPLPARCDASPSCHGERFVRLPRGLDVLFILRTIELAWFVLG
jgi:hypothetical protein